MRFTTMLLLTGFAVGMPTLDLGTAGNYAILTKTGVSTVPGSTITGNIGVSPIAQGGITGFGLEFPTGITTYKTDTSNQIVGKVYAADLGSPTPSQLTTAVSDMETAYTAAAGRLNPDATRINYGSGLLGVGSFGTLANPLTTGEHGVYTFGTDVIINGDLYLSGDENSVFIIQVAGNVVLSANTKMTLLGGVLPENIFFQVSGYVSAEAGAHVEGIILAKTHVAFVTGSSLNGRVLAQTACTLQMTTITEKP